MINKELFYCLTGQPRDIYMRPVPRLRAHPKAIANVYIAEGYAKEFYSMTGKDRIYSWFWGKGEYVIPTSGYSNLILSEGATTIEMDYSKMIRSLRESEDVRKAYKGARELHRLQIEERIKEIRTFTPVERYISLLSKKPWVFEVIPKSEIASYLNISMGALQKFSSIKA